MKKIIVSASSKNQDKIKKAVSILKEKYEILDYPKMLDENNLVKDYSKVFKNFMSKMLKADVMLAYNYDKDGVCGYIGAGTFAELYYVITNNLLNKTSIKVYLYKMPDKSVKCYEEIILWLELGWIKLWDNEIVL